MADAVSPRHHWSDWSRRTVATHGLWYYCATGTVSPVPDQYALVTDKQTDRQTEGHRHHVKPTLCGGGLIISTL